MKLINEFWGEVDEQGRLNLPPEAAQQYGLLPGARILLQRNNKSLHLQHPTNHLDRIYVEPTSRCNLTCRTCIRNAWNESQGDMSDETFERVLAGLKEFPAPAEIFFGGFGEPLAHPRILDMVAQAKYAARSVELITNGILLDEACARRLIDLRLDKLWVSVDGATPENYSDVRIGATLPSVIENITRFNTLREGSDRPEIGISFVAMRKNFADLPLLLRQASRLGVSHFMITNVFPYSREMCAEMLCTRSVDDMDSSPSYWVPRVDLPRMDINDTTQGVLFDVLRNRHNVNLNGAALGQDRGRCPFIERGSLAVGWQGDVSPCLALMHQYQTYLNDAPRKVERCVYGNVNEKSLAGIWNEKEYTDFRQRVAAFDFSPCTICGGCSWSEANQEDCFANPFPTCGGCLWAQGVIQCP